MQKLLQVVIVCCVFCNVQIHARICGTIQARNTVKSLESELRNCTIVVGNVVVALHEIYSPHYHNVSFPELREITGFLLFFNVHHVKTLGTLFPNLAVIRGDNTISGYTFIIYELLNLEEINLPNLRYIEKGSVRIQRCPKLCYVNTVNWTQIGAPLDYYDQNPGDCEECSSNCNGYCWNENQCQNPNPKHCADACLICDQLNQGRCLSCKSSYYLNEGKCIFECPKDKLKNSETRTCMTEADCLTNFRDIWWSFHGQCTRKCPTGYMRVSKEDGWCRHCGEYCKKVCYGGVIEENFEARRYANCTHIDGNLLISGGDKLEGEELYNSLSSIREIGGYLKIHNMNAATTLDFLKNLKVIKGEMLVSNTYALVVLDNDNLHNLWTAEDFSLKIERGAIYFHYNPQLCFSEIEKFLSAAGITAYTEFDVSRFANGYKKSCYLINLNFSLENITSGSAIVKWQDSTSYYDNDGFVAYIFHYAHDPFGNLTTLSERNDCSFHTWFSVLVTTNFYEISTLTPFTDYVCYVEVHTTNQTSMGRSRLFHFKTLPGEPSDVAFVTVTSSENAVLLSWDPPQFLNGIFSHYEIRITVLDIHPYISEERNYCLHPHLNGEEPVDDIDIPLDFSLQSDCCKNKTVQVSENDRVVKRDFLENSGDPLIVDTTTLNITSLQPFKIYNMFLSACNHETCSGSTMIHQRTKPKADADDIPDIKFAIKKSNVFLQWVEPPTPNAIIVSYTMEYRKTDLNDTLSNTECITRSEYFRNNYSHTIRNLQPGNYTLKINAASLAGPGRPSKSIKFEIKAPPEIKAFHVEIVGGSIGIILILATTGIVYYYFFFGRNKASSKYSILQPAESFYELLRKEIEMEEMDNWNKGRICNGFIRSQNRPCTIIPVQICKKKYPLQRLLKEISNLKVCSTHHVVNFLGVVSKVETPLLIVELMELGDLKSFLKSYKNLPERLTDIEMYQMAAEIADGLMYLNSKDISHKDLATRNCMVSAGQTIKIMNFSITKDLYVDDYYENQDGKLIPVRWMAPESLVDGKITCTSNVWTFGIVLWEIVTYGEQPYGELSNEDVIAFVKNEDTLGQPQECPDLLYEMMVACWKLKINERPPLAKLLKRLQSHTSPNFKLISFYHSKEGRKYKKLVNMKNEDESLLTGTNPVMQWKKTNEDEVELLLAEELPNQQIPSTSRFV